MIRPPRSVPSCMADLPIAGADATPCAKSCDTETTGLDPTSHWLIESAASSWSIAFPPGRPFTAT
jgi:hypothetical protein